MWISVSKTLLWLNWMASLSTVIQTIYIVFITYNTDDVYTIITELQKKIVKNSTGTINQTSEEPKTII